MRTHHEIGLMTEACNRLAANYAFLAVYSNIIIINVCECCVNYIKMLMQLTSITVINILTMFVSQFVYCIISDHTDGTAVQRATNNVDACTQCAYLFLYESETLSKLGNILAETLQCFVMFSMQFNFLRERLARTNRKTMLANV